MDSTVRFGRAQHALELLGAWLTEVDSMPLECDGASGVVSTLLAREEIAHEVRVGSLKVVGCGQIPLHWWVELPDGVVIDFRARMWLGQHAAVPHGAFVPDSGQQYGAERGAIAGSVGLSAPIFHILAGMPLHAYPRLGGR